MKSEANTNKQEVYDQMIETERRTGQCPVWLIDHIDMAERFKRCEKYKGCAKCVKAWVYEEA